MQPLTPDTCYHIFNHANGFENVFREAENYRYFLEKYQLYIQPIAETYAYCLMPNHFHLVVRIRKRNVIENLINSSRSNSTPSNSTFSNSTFSNSTFSKVSNFGKGNIVIRDSDIEKYLSKQFANLFSCYTQSFNKVYKRKGSLFIKNFKREAISDKQHFLNAVVYTHRNPIHHGFRNQYNEWEFSSYSEILPGKSELINTDKLFKTFGGNDQFIQLHRQSLEKLEFSNELEIP
jgi:REP element-mobilizing transposase RayT